MRRSAIPDDSMTLAGAPVPPVRGEQSEEGYVATSLDESLLQILRALEFPIRIQTEFAVNDRHYVLRRLMVIELRREGDDCVFASSPALPVSGVGENPEKALEDFYDSFDALYRHLTEVSESQLTEGGRERRATLEGLVKSVDVQNQRAA